MDRTVLITGATSGFGRACAEKFAGNGFRVIISGRRKEKLDDLAKELSDKYATEVKTLAFDVQDKETVFASIAGLDEEWRNIDILINNAGLALGRDFFEEAHLDDWETMIGTNLNGVMYVSKAVLPEMIRRKKGHIINIGSTAGKEVYEKGNMYCATKHALDALSKAMRIDLLRHRIKVTSIHPGAADTSFSSVRFKGDEDQAKKVYEGYEPLHAADVAEVIFYTTTLPEHVCINDLVLTCTAQANSFYTFKS